MRIDFSQFEKPPVLDYGHEPPPRTLREWFIDLPQQATEELGGLTFCLSLVGLSLMTIGMIIGTSINLGAETFAIGFIILGAQFILWTMNNGRSNGPF